MEVTTQGMPYEAWKDNEYIEDLVKKLQESGTNVVVGSFDKLINWGRFQLYLAAHLCHQCCGIEFVSLGAARYDMARFWLGSCPSLATPGRLHDGGRYDCHRMVPVFRRLYDQLAEPNM